MSTSLRSSHGKHTKVSTHGKHEEKDYEEKKLTEALPQTFAHYRLVAHGDGGNDHGDQLLSTNHTRAYLLLPHLQSVEIDMAAVPGTRTGKFTFKWKNFWDSDSRAKVQDFTVMGSKRVQDVLNLVRDLELHDYELSDDTYGCRYWQ